MDGFEGYSLLICGWNGWMNYVCNVVEVCWEDYGIGLYFDVDVYGFVFGIEVIKDVVEGVFGIEILYYVFVDMYGFVEFVDVFGGVDINVIEWLFKGGLLEGWIGIDVNEWVIGWIEFG